MEAHEVVRFSHSAAASFAAFSAVLDLDVLDVLDVFSMGIDGIYTEYPIQNSRLFIPINPPFSSIHKTKAQRIPLSIRVLAADFLLGLLVPRRFTLLGIWSPTRLKTVVRILLGFPCVNVPQ